MKAATRERDTWGADWRQRDFDFFSSSEFQKLLRDNQIHLITWREIGRIMNPPAKRSKTHEFSARDKRKIYLEKPFRLHRRNSYRRRDLRRLDCLFALERKSPARPARQ